MSCRFQTFWRLKLKRGCETCFLPLRYAKKAAANNPMTKTINFITQGMLFSSFFAVNNVFSNNFIFRLWNICYYFWLPYLLLGLKCKHRQLFRLNTMLILLQIQKSFVPKLPISWWKGKFERQFIKLKCFGKTVLSVHSSATKLRRETEFVFVFFLKSTSPEKTNKITKYSQNSSDTYLNPFVSFYTSKHVVNECAFNFSCELLVEKVAKILETFSSFVIKLSLETVLHITYKISNKMPWHLAKPIFAFFPNLHNLLYKTQPSWDVCVHTYYFVVHTASEIYTSHF